MNTASKEAITLAAVLGPFVLLAMQKLFLVMAVTYFTTL